MLRRRDPKWPKASARVRAHVPRLGRRGMRRVAGAKGAEVWICASTRAVAARTAGVASLSSKPISPTWASAHSVVWPKTRSAAQRTGASACRSSAATSLGSVPGKLGARRSKSVTAEEAKSSPLSAKTQAAALATSRVSPRRTISASAAALRRAMSSSANWREASSKLKADGSDMRGASGFSLRRSDHAAAWATAGRRSLRRTVIFAVQGESAPKPMFPSRMTAARHTSGSGSSRRAAASSGVNGNLALRPSLGRCAQPVRARMRKASRWDGWVRVIKGGRGLPMACATLGRSRWNFYKFYRCVFFLFRRRRRSCPKQEGTEEEGRGPSGSWGKGFGGGSFTRRARGAPSPAASMRPWNWLIA